MKRPQPSSRSDAARILTRLWIRTLKEPTLLAGLLYTWITAVGFAHLFGTGQGIGVNIIDLASPSDFLISGLRDPFVTLLAIVTRCGIFAAIGIAVKGRSNGVAVFMSAAALLVAGAMLSAWYRRSVTSGFLSGRPGSPCPLVMSLEDGEQLSGRMGTATADFLVIVRDANRTVIVPRGKIKSIELDCSAGARARKTQ